jgi:hypothetical protein
LLSLAPLWPGGSKRALLATFPVSKFKHLCLGSVDSSKFCIKDHLLGPNSCGTRKHEGSKYLAAQDAFYVKHNEVQAYCQPVIDATLLNESQKNVMAEKMLLITEGMEVFDGIESGSPPGWIPKTSSNNDVDSMVMSHQMLGSNYLVLQPLSILSPMKGDATVFDYQSSLSFDSTDSSVMWTI